MCIYIFCYICFLLSMVKAVIYMYSYYLELMYSHLKCLTYWEVELKCIDIEKYRLELLYMYIKQRWHYWVQYVLFNVWYCRLKLHELIWYELISCVNHYCVLSKSRIGLFVVSATSNDTMNFVCENVAVCLLQSVKWI